MEQDQSVASLGEQVKIYMETKVEIVRLTAIQKGAQIIAGAVTQLALSQLLLLFLFFGGLAVAAWVKEETGKESLGYAVVGLFFLLKATIYFMIRRNVQRRLEERFISKMANDETN